ncbi:diacylglycerol pyrophosphate phosphatase [Aspergillus flavus AF70]|nr:diacylglycerol pyrophosphate phosphatase [Aspergillus flavus AF70]
MPFATDNQHSSILGSNRTSKLTISSYILDWIVVIVLAAVGGILYKITGNQHAFSLGDPNISYPLYSDTFSITVVGILALAVPAVIIMVLSLLIPTSTITASGHGTRGLSPTKSRLWEWHTGWLGLCLSLAGAFFVVSGLKDIVGKPRPDFLARCNPDLSNISAHLAGGLGLRREGAAVLVRASICQNTDAAVIKDGFAAFPSGHSSFAWAGLLYLSLWLCAKFAIIPPSHRTGHSALTRNGPPAYPLTSRPAAPPLYLLLIATIPVGLALCICATRYSDYMHAGWDIMSATIIGIFFACLSFRWYHTFPSTRLISPTEDGGGWAFPPRSRSHALWVAYGSRGYAENDNISGYEDLELGPVGH